MALLQFVCSHLLFIHRWQTNWNIAAFPASTSCVTIAPEASSNPTYVEDDDLLEARSMLNLIYLPDGRIFGGTFEPHDNRTANAGGP